MASATKAKKKQHAPGPKSKAPGDQLIAINRDPLKFLMKVAKEYPDVAHFKLGPQHTFLLSHPDYIQCA